MRTYKLSWAPMVMTDDDVPCWVTLPIDLKSLLLFNECDFDDAFQPSST